jgi:hypothetical protein
MDVISLPTEIITTIFEKMSIPDVYTIYNKVEETRIFIDNINSQYWTFPTNEEDIKKLLLNACYSDCKETISYILYNITSDNKMISFEILDEMTDILVKNNNDDIIIFLIKWIIHHELFNNVNYKDIYKMFYKKFNNNIKSFLEELI